MRIAAILIALIFIPVHSQAQVNHQLFKIGMELRPPVSLEGSRASLVWQNFKLDIEGLKRIKDDKELEELIKAGTLVPIPVDGCLKPNPKFDKKWHFILQRVATFSLDISEKICPGFNLPVRVNSAVRHIPRQKELSRRNLNAAPIEGERASTHLTGAAIDIAIVGFPRSMVEWLSTRLIELENLGLIDATLENKAQNVFHVTVFEEYEAYQDE